jgi:hypothetical protein
VPAVEIRIAAETTASVEDVLAGVCDFSERRARIWPNVKEGHFEVHHAGGTYAEATEELWPTGIWERCRYDWSRPGTVTATVLDSNSLAPGSTWELIASPSEGGTRVEAVFLRDYQRTPRGLFTEAVNRVAGPMAGRLGFAACVSRDRKVHAMTDAASPGRYTGERIHVEVE